MTDISWDDFQKVELRAGTIIKADLFQQARCPAYILHIDFGDTIGIKKSSAQITDYYDPESLIGKQVMAVTNFPPKQIGPIMSECLVTGFFKEGTRVALATIDMDVPNGTRLV